MPKPSMTVRVLFCLIFGCLFLSSVAQQQLPGYYISKTGDTVRGNFLNYRQRNSNPTAVTFSGPGNAGTLTLTPANCQAFKIEGSDSYLAFHGLRMTNAATVATASAGESAEVYDSVAVFLREIAGTDRYSFFVLNDRLRINLFYRGRDGNVQELIKQVSIVDGQVVESLRYRTQLEDLFSDSNKKIQARSVLYSEESLADFIGERANARVANKRERSSTNGFLLAAGVSASTLKFNANASYPFTTESFKGSISPVISLGYVATLSRNLTRLFLYPQIKVYSFNHVAESTAAVGQIHFTSTFKSPVIALALNAGYNIIDNSTLKFSLIPGATFSFISKNNLVEKVDYSTTSQQSSHITKMNNRIAMLSIQGQLVIRNHCVIWGGYFLPASVANQSDIKGKLSAVQAGIGYKL